MKNLFFSQMTILVLFTLFMTILYHFICQGTDLNVEVNRQKVISNEKAIKKHKCVKFYKEDDQQIAKSTVGSQEMDDLEVISSEWILDYWKKIRNRKRALKIPNLPPEFNSKDYKELNIDEFLNSQIIEDLIKLIDSEKYYSKKDGLKKFALLMDLCMFGGKNWLKSIFTLTL
jgi:hypothetical protein